MDKLEQFMFIAKIRDEIEKSTCDFEESYEMYQELKSIDNKIDNLMEWINLHKD